MCVGKFTDSRAGAVFHAEFNTIWRETLAVGNVGEFGE